MEIGLGQLGLSPDEFWSMTPLEFLCAQSGFWELFKTREKENWQRTIQLINIQLPRKDRLTLDGLFKEKPPKDTRSPEERQKEIDKISKLKHWKPLDGSI
jgi:hypothetical protein